MKIIVVNCGSSSLKYRIISMPEEKEIAGGEAQRIGPKTAEPSRIIHRVGEKTETHLVEMRNHAEALEEVRKLLSRDSSIAPDAFGHRVVHGGGIFSSAAQITAGSARDLEKIKHLAPIHNPPAMEVIYACEKAYPGLPSVAVFDTAFHATIPDFASTYCIPREITEKLKIRKFGFHGTSHQFVAEEAARIMKRPFNEFSAVSCHLGSGGASICAIVNGKSVDNTMGYSPLQGLVMSTRCGDLDPALTLNLLQHFIGSTTDVERLLNTRSGVLGMSGSSADIRDILSMNRKSSGNTRSHHTAEAYLWRIKKYIGSYLAVVGKPDALIFTDTIGETIPQVRWAVCSDMEYFGLKIDAGKNDHADVLPSDVSHKDSSIKILVVATNEELAIARRTYGLLSENHNFLWNKKLTNNYLK
ncbi:MAG: hypothetical protein A2X45_10090 [Lentisphaerae bacterium GWF2_50_93]|nr:MAG: hypothetical protein A2X45_10090 [Lentisphaerae bacterium GWF2_50_93]